MLSQVAVTSDIFQPADEHEFEDDGVEGGLPGLAIDRVSLQAQKLLAKQLAQAAIEIRAWQARGATKLRDDFIGELLVVLHSPLTYSQLIRYFCNTHNLWMRVGCMSCFVN